VSAEGTAPGHVSAEPVDQAMYCLTVAASGLVTDYSDVRCRGYLKDHPDEVAYRLDLVEHAIAAVRAKVVAEHIKWRREQVQGGMPLPDPDGIAASHHKQVADFVAHRCDCVYCLGPGADPGGPRYEVSQ
jgi:hypothetical protein